MKRDSVILLIFLTAHGVASPAPFTEPKAHPISRYEAGWQKNPFTLKTAPPAMAPKESFAKDLALAGWLQAGDDTIVRLVNTKTREFTRLKNQEPGSDGTKVKSAQLKDRKAETFVELELKGETAVVRYDEAYLRTMAAAQGAAAQGAAGKGNPQVAMRGPNAYGQQGQLPPGVNVNPAAGVQPQPAVAPNMAPNIVAPGVTTIGRGSIVPPIPNAQAPQAASPINNVPTIQRRRLNTLPQPIQPR